MDRLWNNANNYLLCDRQIFMKNLISYFRWHPGNHLSKLFYFAWHRGRCSKGIEEDRHLYYGYILI